MTEIARSDSAIGIYALIFLGVTAVVLGVVVYFLARFFASGFSNRATPWSIRLGLMISSGTFAVLAWAILVMYGVVNSD